MTRRLNYWLLASLIVFGFPFYWYLIDSGAGSAKAKPVTIEQLRRLADAAGGQHPDAVRVELIGHYWIMRDKLIAGGGVREASAAVRSYELTVPGNKPIVIDAGTSRTIAQQNEMDDFDQVAQNRVNTILRQASHLIILQDSPLHNGGRNTDEVAAETKRQQHDSAPYALVPGVVVLPADNLGPRAKLVYVRLANGQEFLFTGPGALIAASIDKLRPPARLAARKDVPDYATESKSWLMTINALQREAPDMTVVTAHDSSDISHATNGFSNIITKD